ncbi:HNH endonuclease [Paraburkholderia sp. Tr-20389]|uniref:HNH endonuclease n=1 Tax=Paraburkholderia sp. Tr-20389 TaxID=2703903 RepID=UPI00197D8AC6|nr:HNH endonuclease [Paraburkholderia sp. Tr-20389]MBN3757168.1 HNH endonuclease [Paraburkholderia sp. Tr-20389]
MTAMDDGGFVAHLRSVLDYSIVSGRFYWKVSPSTQIKAGSRAGGPDKKGYQVIRIKGRGYFAHRLAWVWLLGEWPNGFVDHENGAPSANGWHNLREATNAENQQNQKPRPSKTGIKGVCINMKRGAPHVLAYLDANGQHLQKYFGRDTPENRAAAESWVREKRAELHGEFAHHGAHMMGGAMPMIQLSK